MPIEASELPSGSFVSVKHDGFTIESNTGTADDLRGELGIATSEPPADGPPAEPAQTPPPTPERRNGRRSAYMRLEEATAKEAAAKRERDEAKAETDRLRAEIEALKKPAAPAQAAPVQAPAAQSQSPAPLATQPASEDPEPKIEDAKYQGAADPYTAWLLDRNAWGTRREVNRAIRQQQAHAAEMAQHQAWMERVAKTPDFQAKFNPNTPVHREIVPYLKRIDFGPQVMLYLSEHQDEAQRLTTLHPVEQIGQIGEIVGLLKARTAAASTNGSAPTPPAVSQAKPLVRPLVGGPSHGTPEPPGDDASEEQHEAYYGKVRRQFR